MLKGEEEGTSITHSVVGGGSRITYTVLKGEGTSIVYSVLKGEGTSITHTVLKGEGTSIVYSAERRGGQTNCNARYPII